MASPTTRRLQTTATVRRPQTTGAPGIARAPDRHTRGLRRSPPQRSPPQVKMGLRAFVLIACIVCLSFGVPASGQSPSCSNTITAGTMEAVDRLIGNQLLISCNVDFTFVDVPEGDMDSQQKACYVRKAMPLVYNLLKFLERSYRANSQNYNDTQELKKVYISLHTNECFSSTRGPQKKCNRTFSMTPVKMMGLVKDLFSLSRELLQKSFDFIRRYPEKDCDNLYKCEEPEEEDVTTAGPTQCTCSCPSPEPTSTLLTSIKTSSALQGSKEATGTKEQPPAQYTSSASRDGGLRIARTLQNVPGTPASMQIPGTVRAPSVIKSPPTAVFETPPSEAKSISLLNALEPSLHGTELFPSPTLRSPHTSTTGSEKDQAKDQRLQGTSGQSLAPEVVEGRTVLTQPGDFRIGPSTTVSHQPSTQDNIFGSTEALMSMNVKAAPHQPPNQDSIVGSTEAFRSGTEEATAHQLPTLDYIIGSTEVPLSMKEKAAPNQQSTLDYIIGSTDAPVSGTEEAAAYQPSTLDYIVGSTKAPVPRTEEATAHQTSTSDYTFGSAEAPVPGTEEDTAHQTSTLDYIIGSTEAPVPGTVGATAHQALTLDYIIGSTEVPASVTEEATAHQPSALKKLILQSTTAAQVTDRVALHQTSSHVERTGSSEVPVSLTKGHNTGVQDTHMTERPSVSLITPLVTDDATMVAPSPETEKAIHRVPQKLPRPLGFQDRGEGMQQFDGRGESAVGPHSESNFLPLYGPGSEEKRKGVREEPASRAYLYVVVKCILGILTFLCVVAAVCGLLYYRRKCQILMRELQRTTSRAEHQEEWPLNGIPVDQPETEV